MILQYFMTKCPRMVIFLDGYNIYNLVFNYFYTICFCSMAKMQNSISRHWLAISYNKCFFYICNTQLLDHCLLAFGINTDKHFENNSFLFASFYINFVNLHIKTRLYGKYYVNKHVASLHKAICFNWKIFRYIWMGIWTFNIQPFLGILQFYYIEMIHTNLGSKYVK